MALAFACGEGSEYRDGRLCVTDQALLGAPLATGPAFSFVGALGKRLPNGSTSYQCSAVLVAEARAITAKHCVVAELDDTEAATLVFSAGADLAQPADTVDVHTVLPASPAAGGYTGLGSDLAVLELARPVRGVRHAQAGLFAVASQSTETTFSTYGYGASNGDEVLERRLSPMRRGGPQTLRATKGNLFQRLYGSFEAFSRVARRDRLVGAASTSCDEEPAVRAMARADLKRVYESGALLPGLEVWLGNDDNEPQTCYGDSGGPLVASTPEGPRVVGVASWSWRSASSPCAFGTVYALITPQVLAALTTP